MRENDDGAGLRCRLLWKLSRGHRWGSPVPQRELVENALDAEDVQQGYEICDDLPDEPYIQVGRGGRLGVQNDPDSQAQLAFVLRDQCGFSELRIEATLSRFEQKGGFDYYDDPP